mmetsp:Transcript_47116/g.111744  ORF Transcript_47116/g.111744 Transcript_47116/m.111744 type:complete len:228 (-) Transcript_47116:93-776(-)
MVTVPYWEPVSRARGKRSRTFCGWSVLAMSTSQGCSPDRQSRMHPPTSQTTPPPSCSIKSMESTRSCGSLSTHAARFGGSSSATIPASASCQVVVSSVVVVLCCFPPSVSLFTPPVDDIVIALVLCTGCREPGRRECGEASGSFRLFPERRPSLSAVDFNPDRDSSLSDWNAAGQVAIKAEKCRGLCGEGHDCKTSGKQWPVQRRVQEQMTPAENSARRWLGLRRYR